MSRAIIHSDINHCYAQIEEMKNPFLRTIPMAVGGNQEKRHGIILAKNDLAKTYGIKTGESLLEAYEKCPNLKIISPNYEEYLYYTDLVKDIYREYSDQVESLGLDEAWVDLTRSQQLYGSAINISREIQKRIYFELGLTVSMGLSFNKIFAKMGSDLNKHNGFITIDKNNYRKIIWPLDIRKLFYVGRATEKKLKARGINTIGDLARQSCTSLEKFLGVNGRMLWNFANGLDISDVDDFHQVKSVGNGITAIHDLHNRQEVKLVFYVLCEAIVARLKKQDMAGWTITITMKNNQFKTFTRQKNLDNCLNTTNAIMEIVMALVDNNCPIDKSGNYLIPYRNLSISVSNLQTNSSYQQLSLFENQNNDNDKFLDHAIETIRERFGFDKIKRCSMLLDKDLTNFNPLEEHIIHPESFF